MLKGWVSKRKGGKKWRVVVDFGWKEVVDAGETHRQRDLRTETVGTKGQALLRLDELRRLHDAGSSLSTSTLTVAQYMAQWYKDYAVPRLAPSTLRSHDSLIKNHVVPAIGRVPLDKLTPMHLQAFYADKLSTPNKQGKTLSPTTVLYIHRIVHIALRHAVQWGLVSRNVAESAEPPKPSRRKTVAPTLDEVEKIWGVADEPFKTIILIAYLTGMRLGEVLGLHLEDVHGGTITINRTLQKLPGKPFAFKDPKRHSVRTIPICGRVARALEAHKSFASPTGLVFCGRDGQPLHPTSVYHAFVRYAKKVGITGMTFHDLRHGYASMLLGHGLDARLISDNLGHHSVKLTLDTYTHVSTGMRDIVAQKVDELAWRRFGDIGEPGDKPEA